MSAERTDLAKAKAVLRLEIRAQRAAILPRDREAASSAAARRAASLPDLAGVRVVLGYHALAEEIDPAPLIRLLRRRGALVALPRVTVPGELTLHWADLDEELLVGSLGVMEPVAGSPGPALDVVDLVIVPGVAFDPSGGRLGLGGGFYDRLLSRLSATARTVALAYDAQIVDEVPTGPFDRRVGVVATPTVVYQA